MPRFAFASILVALVTSIALAQPAPKPKWVDAQDLLVRVGGEKNFTKTTPKVGVEFYLDSVGGALIAITEAGTISAVPATSIGGDRKATWGFAHDLRARKADEEGWKAAKPFGVEAFKYPAGKVIAYVSEAKGLTLAELPGQVGADSPPAWHHGLVLKVVLRSESIPVRSATATQISGIKTPSRSRHNTSITVPHRARGACPRPKNQRRW